MVTVKQTAIRLRPEDLELLAALQEKLGLRQTDVIRVALRRLAELERVTVAPKKPPKK